MENGINNTEINQVEKLNDRLNLCMEEYNKKVTEVSVLTVNAVNVFANVHKNNKVMGNLSDRESEIIITTMDLYKNNREYYSSLNVPKVKNTLGLNKYIAEYETKLGNLTKEIYGILAEVWLLVNIAEEVDEGIQQFLDIAFAGPKYGEFKLTLDSIDESNIESIKDLYMSDPELALSTLRDIVKDIYETKIIEKEVMDDVNQTEKEVVEDVLTFMEVIEDDTEDDDHKSDNTNDNSSNKIDYGTITKVGLGIIGILALGYAGKKLYDHFNSDDVVIIDSDGLDFSSAFGDYTTAFDNIKTEW